MQIYPKTLSLAAQCINKMRVSHEDYTKFLNEYKERIDSLVLKHDFTTGSLEFDNYPDGCRSLYLYLKGQGFQTALKYDESVRLNYVKINLPMDVINFS